MMQNRYIISLKEETYSPKKKATTVKFSAFVKEQRILLGEIEGKKVSTKDLAKRMGLDYEVFRKVINKQKPTKKRDFIIVLCAILYLYQEKTNEALSLYGMPELDKKNERDRILINILDDRAYYLPTADEYDEQDESSMQVIQEINNQLSLNHQAILDIADRRGGKPAMKSLYPYTMLRKRVECRTDELIYEDPFSSLQTLYEPEKYRIFAEMWVVDKRSQRKYHLTAEPEGYYTKSTILEDAPQNGERSNVVHQNEEAPDEKLQKKYEQFQTSEIEYEQFQSLDKTDSFRECFLDLKRMAASELKSILLCIKDTKNYKGRKSARIIDGQMHVFFEEFNYSVPELGEYYLLDYSEGKYSFSVSEESRFMELYLKPELYKKLYRKKATVKEEYESAKENTDNLFQNAGNNAFIGLRRSAFRCMKEELDVFIETIRKKETKIRNADLAFESPSDLLQYFGIVSDHIEQDNKILDLPALKNAFELGLDSVEEIWSFLRNCKSLEIEELL